jgi:hypothetical protein
MPPAVSDADAAGALALAPPPVEAGGVEGAALLADGLAPPLHAETTIAITANGAARRRNDCFVVKSDLLWSGVTGIRKDVAPRERSPARSDLLLLRSRSSWRRPIRRVAPAGQSRAFHRRQRASVKSVNE